MWKLNEILYVNYLSARQIIKLLIIKFQWIVVIPTASTMGNRFVFADTAHRNSWLIILTRGNKILIKSVAVGLGSWIRF